MLDAHIQKDWWVNWGFIVPEGLADEDELSRGYISKDRLACRLEAYQPPKSKYSRPVLSSHQIGWAPSLELFGVAQYKRGCVADELKPSRKPWRISAQKKVKT